MKDFLVWSWNDKKFNRIILCSAVVCLLGIGAIAGHVWFSPSPVATVHDVYEEVAYIQLSR